MESRKSFSGRTCAGRVPSMPSRRRNVGGRRHQHIKISVYILAGNRCNRKNQQRKSKAKSKFKIFNTKTQRHEENLILMIFFVSSCLCVFVLGLNLPVTRGAPRPPGGRAGPPLRTNARVFVGAGPCARPRLHGAGIQNRIRREDTKKNKGTLSSALCLFFAPLRLRVGFGFPCHRGTLLPIPRGARRLAFGRRESIIRAVEIS